MSNFTVPGINENDAKKLIDGLQERLTDFNDLHLILKHVHWNVTGPSFIGVHEMIDPQVEEVRGYADEVAERIAALGGEPIGTPAGHAEGRTPLQYDLNKADTQSHIRKLAELYTTVIERLRESLAEAGDIDSITEDIYISEAAGLEKFQWFLRAHIEDENGNI